MQGGRLAAMGAAAKGHRIKRHWPNVGWFDCEVTDYSQTGACSGCSAMWLLCDDFCTLQMARE